MKKLILIPALALALCASAEDSYMYWTVANDAVGTDASGADISPGTYSVKISQQDTTAGWVYGAGDYLTLYSSSDGTLGNKLGESVSGIQIGKDANGNAPDNLPYFAELATTSGNNVSYFIELYNDDGIIARTEAISYNQECIATLSGMGMPGDIVKAVSFIPASVPEPNSALLMLLGLAGLALRRRKQVIA